MIEPETYLSRQTVSRAPHHLIEQETVVLFEQVTK